MTIQAVVSAIAPVSDDLVFDADDQVSWREALGRSPASLHVRTGAARRRPLLRSTAFRLARVASSSPANQWTKHHAMDGSRHSGESCPGALPGGVAGVPMVR